MRYFLLIILLLSLTRPVSAEELFLLGGAGQEQDHHNGTAAWLLEYLQGLNENFALGISYFNQGHFPHDHRDGHAATLWARTNILDRRLSLAAGAGPIYYYDTVHSSDGLPSFDVHGWGGVFNATASWYADNRIIYQLRGKYVVANRGFDTMTILAGIGYQLDAPESPGPRPEAPPQTERTTNNELTLFYGQTKVNLPDDGHSSAVKIEYRRGIWKYVEWTGGFMYEGRSSLIDRYGLTTQLWLAKPFFRDRLALGVGVGGYFAHDNRRHERGYDDQTVAEMFTITSSYRFSPSVLMRISWDRVITSYDRDTDVFLAGIGYRF